MFTTLELLWGLLEITYLFSIIVTVELKKYDAILKVPTYLVKNMLKIFVL